MMLARLMGQINCRAYREGGSKHELREPFYPLFVIPPSFHSSSITDHKVLRRTKSGSEAETIVVLGPGSNPIHPAAAGVGIRSSADGVVSCWSGSGDPRRPTGGGETDSDDPPSWCGAVGRQGLVSWGEANNCRNRKLVD